MKLKIEIKLDNAAFEDDPNEISRILHDIATLKKLAYGYPQPRERENVYDFNGNNIGYWEITDEES